MELTIVNETGAKKWNQYRKDFLTLMKQAQDKVGFKDDVCLSVIFVDADGIHEINRTYRNIDRPTDVISFALLDCEDLLAKEESELGDIFINVEAVVDQAKDYQHTIRREVCFLFTHGLLHLLGYDHMNEEDEKKMFALQDEIIDPIVKKRYRKYEE
ncbi:MAG: rRNA maturation RNase YbeY [Erysipelotrichaceae bacterium]|nr:rRNA maturation RNase YbeY [Erysipelotrichaceae bacterium]